MSMTSRQGAELAVLISAGVKVEVYDISGGPFDTSWVEYAIFIPDLQKGLLETDDLEEFDGVHYLDESTYVGLGDSLEQAFEDFLQKNVDLTDAFNDRAVDQGGRVVLDLYVADKLASEDE